MSDGQGQSGQPGKQCGLIAVALCSVDRRRGGHEKPILGGIPTPMTAGDQADAPASFAQRLRHCDNQGGLARAPHEQIANHHDASSSMGRPPRFALRNCLTLALGEATDCPGRGAQQESGEPRKAFRRSEPESFQSGFEPGPRVDGTIGCGAWRGGA